MMSESRPPRWLAGTAALVGVVLAIAVSNAPLVAGADQPPSAQLPTTSVETTGGSWVTLPMGHLDDPLNTFWQLLFRPAGSTTWSDDVEPTATATNGGLVIDGSGPSLTVGIRPSQFLVFTPLIQTPDSGRSWSNGLITAPLGANPDALASDAAGDALAVVGGRSGEQVLTSTRNAISSWTGLLSLRELAGQPVARRCSPSAISAVAYLDGSPVIGTACRAPGVGGIFILRGGRWQMPGTALPAGSRGQADVLQLHSDAGGLHALLRLSGARGDSLISASSSDGSNWTQSAPLVLGSRQLVSSGSMGDGGAFALLGTLSGKSQVAVAPAHSTEWRVLPSLPVAAAAAVPNGDGGFDAMTVNDTQLTVWTLGPSASGWHRGQVLHVPVQFGSSNP